MSRVQETHHVRAAAEVIATRNSWRKVAGWKTSSTATSNTPASISLFLFFFSSRRRHTRLQGDWSSDVCSSDLVLRVGAAHVGTHARGRPAARRPADVGRGNDLFVGGGDGGVVPVEHPGRSR